MAFGVADTCVEGGIEVGVVWILLFYSPNVLRTSLSHHSYAHLFRNQAMSPGNAIFEKPTPTLCGKGVSCSSLRI